MHQDGSEGDLANVPGLKNPPTKERGRLILTLCIPGTAGAYPRAVIPYPDSYSDACRAALSAFKNRIPEDAERIALKVAVRTCGGGTEWAAISPVDWGMVIPQESEIGVFLSGSSSFDLPYVPEIVYSDKPQNVATFQVRADPNLRKSAPAPPSKIVYLMYVAEGKEDKIVTLTTNSYKECLDIAVAHFQKSQSAPPSASGSVFGSQNPAPTYPTASTFSSPFAPTRSTVSAFGSAFQNPAPTQPTASAFGGLSAFQNPPPTQSTVSAFGGLSAFQNPAPNRPTASAFSSSFKNPAPTQPTAPLFGGSLVNPAPSPTLPAVPCDGLSTPPTIQLEVFTLFAGKPAWSVISDAALFSRLLSDKFGDINIRASILNA